MNTLLAIINFILLYSTGDSAGERWFIGGLTGATFALILYFINKKNQKKQEDNHQKEIKASQEKNYIDTLKKIVKESNQIIYFDFDSTKEYLLDKTNPKHFLNNSKLKQIEIATVLFQELKQLKDVKEISILVNLKNRAYKELNIDIPNVELFQALESILNPEFFVDDNFDKDKLLATAKARKWLSENKDKSKDIEDFACQIGLFKYKHMGDNNDTRMPIVVNGKREDYEDEVVSVCGLYPMKFDGVFGNCYHFKPIKSYMQFGTDFTGEKLKQYLKYDYLGKVYFSIPIDKCIAVSPNDVKIIE